MLAIGRTDVTVCEENRFGSGLVDACRGSLLRGPSAAPCRCGKGLYAGARARRTHHSGAWATGRSARGRGKGALLKHL